MRAFISINLTDPIRESILEFQESQGKIIRNIRWTKPENIHLTLKFLGEIEEETVNKLAETLQPIEGQFSPFPVDIGSVGKFPPKGPLSILWVGLLKGTSGVMALENSIREAMEAAKIPFDKKSFVPHLTIGRAMKNKKVFFDNINDFEKLSFGTLQVESFHLMQSDLKPSGPIYTERIRFTFQSR